MFRKTVGIALILVFSLTGIAQALTKIPQKMNYQGYITSSGLPVTAGLQIDFNIYDAPTAGNLLWSETINPVTVTNGIFNEVLGETIAIDLPFRSTYWLTFQVSGDTEMAPRHKLTCAAYANASRKIVYQQVLTVAADGGDTITVSAAIDMLNGVVPFGALQPQPNANLQWVIEVQAGTFNEPGTNGGGGQIMVPQWVTIRGRGWDDTELDVQGIKLAPGSALESLLIRTGGMTTSVDMNAINMAYLREVKIEADAPVGRVVDMRTSQFCELIDCTVVATGGGFNVNLIEIDGSVETRIENCVVDLRQLAPTTNGGISENIIFAIDVFILENTFLYTTSGDNTGTFGVGTNIGSSGRISHNVFYGMSSGSGNEIIDVTTGVFPAWTAPGPGTHGAFNQALNGTVLGGF
ncbi:hypothetical protein K8S19_07520 [bacterium]|nr:hypothetical protein [bacterium]